MAHQLADAFRIAHLLFIDLQLHIILMDDLDRILESENLAFLHRIENRIEGGGLAAAGGTGKNDQSVFHIRDPLHPSKYCFIFA